MICFLFFEKVFNIYFDNYCPEFIISFKASAITSIFFILYWFEEDRTGLPGDVPHSIIECDSSSCDSRGCLSNS